MWTDWTSGPRPVDSRFLHTWRDVRFSRHFPMTIATDGGSQATTIRSPAATHYCLKGGRAMLRGNRTRIYMVWAQTFGCVVLVVKDDEGNPLKDVMAALEKPRYPISTEKLCLSRKMPRLLNFSRRQISLLPKRSSQVPID